MVLQPSLSPGMGRERAKAPAPASNKNEEGSAACRLSVTCIAQMVLNLPCTRLEVNKNQSLSSCQSGVTAEKEGRDAPLF